MSDTSLAERVGLEVVVARIRWVGVALGLVQTFMTDPPPISRAGCLAVSLAMAGTNVAASMIRRMRPRSVERLIALCLVLDFMVCTGWVLLLANDRYSTSYVMFSLVGIEAAVLYGWRGTFAFMGAFLASFAVLYWERAAVLGFPLELGSFQFRATVVLMLAAFAGGIANQSDRRQQAATELMAKLEDLASSDALTGLRNRREFERVLSQTGRDRFALLAIDVDNLKPVNDEFGHEAGDAVLRAVADTLAALLREWDLVARVGGDEFAALLMGASADEALRVAERVRAAMHGVMVPHGRARISIGCAAAEAGTEVRDVWHAADAALFRAKRSGRDRAVCASDEDTWREGAEWAATLPLLIARRELRAVYQPIVRLDDGTPVGYEALARPRGQSAGASVEALFTAAQRLGVARDLDWLCRRTAIQGAHDLPPGVPVFVNVGVATLLDPIHDVDQMLLLLRWCGRTPREVVLEITERETIIDLGRLREVLGIYRNEGFRIAVDDVGEGRCTLEVLAAAMPEFLKLAGTLVLDADSPGPRAAIEAAVAFARSSGATVIAEGVETSREAERMRALGVDAGQGWHLGRPAEGADLDGAAAVLRAEMRSAG